jgi:hypothetical protein
VCDHAGEHDGVQLSAASGVRGPWHAPIVAAEKTVVDIALAEFTALRSEILAVEQFENTAFAAALTILSAIGGFALTKNGGRLEILLVLPIVLSGLSLLQTQCTVLTEQMGKYIRDHLWERVPSDSSAKYPSWEHFLGRERGVFAYAWGVVARTLIFVVPSIVALVINDGHWHGKLAALWWGDVAVLFLTGLLNLAVLTRLHRRHGERP